MRALGTLSVGFVCLSIGCGDDSGVVPPRDSGPSIRTDAGTMIRPDAGPMTGTDAGPMMTRDSGPPRDAARPDAGMMMMGTGATGDPCMEAGDCAGGTCLEMLGAGGFGVTFTGGYCSATCTGMGMGTCEEGAECANLLISMNCLKTCTTAEDCRADEGYMCQALPSIGGGGGGGSMYCLPMLPF